MKRGGPLFLLSFGIQSDVYAEKSELASAIEKWVWQKWLLGEKIPTSANSAHQSGSSHDTKRKKKKKVETFFSSALFTLENLHIMSVVVKW